MGVLDALRSLLGRRSAATLTGSFRGLNWADRRDNFQAGVLYPCGLRPSDTYQSASRVADRVVGQMYSLTGANTVRMPINEPTVAGYWGTYTGAIDTALTKGRVILCYWAAKDGKPADLTAFREMWRAVVEKYGASGNAYFEPINEPHGFTPADLNDFYDNWLGAFSSLPRDRVILDGSKYAQVPATVGADKRLKDCLLGYHEYDFFNSFATEAEWQAHMRSDVGDHYRRTLCTEFGNVMNVGLLSGQTQHDRLLDYGTPSSEKSVVYLRAVTGQLRAWGVGSVYWPGIRDDNIYRLCTKAGSGSRITLSIASASGLARIRHAWGEGSEPSRAER